MRVQYFVEYALRFNQPTGEYYYEAAGVWAHGIGHGLCLTAQYLPGNEEAQDIADWRINTLVEDGVRSLPDTWMAEEQARIPLMRGDRSAVYETDAVSPDAVVEAIFAQIAAGKIQEPPLPPR